MRNKGSAGWGGVAGSLCIRVLYPNIRLGRCCGRGDVQACVAVVAVMVEEITINSIY